MSSPHPALTAWPAALRWLPAVARPVLPVPAAEEEHGVALDTHQPLVSLVGRDDRQPGAPGERATARAIRREPPVSATARGEFLEERLLAG